jgi:hypothetical protein
MANAGWNTPESQVTRFLLSLMENGGKKLNRFMRFIVPVFEPGCRDCPHM